MYRVIMQWDGQSFDEAAADAEPYTSYRQARAYAAEILAFHGMEQGVIVRRTEFDVWQITDAAGSVATVRVAAI